ncbi:hypothetical protein M9H77_03675 [Catharanthus roseus]|uniref:Uncharacterized protein n=1 Tax=Catharanthus roseus TaxID=4058 RepID=A0ACC0CBW0_CATRO|nr:hypothetical protein M9H77_03675 [Catharanthus roseus]
MNNEHQWRITVFEPEVGQPTADGRSWSNKQSSNTTLPAMVGYPYSQGLEIKIRRSNITISSFNCATQETSSGDVWDYDFSFNLPPKQECLELKKDENSRATNWGLIKGHSFPKVPAIKLGKNSSTHYWFVLTFVMDSSNNKRLSNGGLITYVLERIKEEANLLSPNERVSTTSMKFPLFAPQGPPLVSRNIARDSRSFSIRDYVASQWPTELLGLDGRASEGHGGSSSSSQHDVNMRDPRLIG